MLGFQSEFLQGQLVKCIEALAEKRRKKEEKEKKIRQDGELEKRRERTNASWMKCQ